MTKKQKTCLGTNKEKFEEFIKEFIDSTLEWDIVEQEELFFEAVPKSEHDKIVKMHVDEINNWIKSYDKLKEENKKLNDECAVLELENLFLKNSIPKEKVRTLLLNFLVYAEYPKATKKDKEVIKMTVESYLEDIDFNEKEKK